MHYLYILKGINSGKCYIGQSSDLKQRLSEHNTKQNVSTAYDKWQLIYYESYMTRALACERERKLKNHGKGLQELKKRIGFDG